MLVAGCCIAFAQGLGAGPALAQSGDPTPPPIVAITEAWLASPHADRTSESFRHWDEDGEIPGACAVCHSGAGFIEYLNGPMSKPGLIDRSVLLGVQVDCAACHNEAAAKLDAVQFPSGATIKGFGASAICTVCHQGRASGNTVRAATDGLDEDALLGDLQFINVHYAPVALTMMGTAAQGGYEYPGKEYGGQFMHVPDLNTCAGCHDPHSLQVSLEDCTSCHRGAESLAAIRTSPADFDGDGDTREGISDPIKTMHTQLGDAIRAYAATVSGAPVVYDVHVYPYFFNDTDGDGVASEAEATFPNRYQSWTPRLLKAAYNYQLVAKEPGIYSHNPHFALQLLYDSLENLSERVDLDISGLVRP